MRPQLANKFERKEMYYLDAVYENNDVIFIGNPQETVVFLLSKEESVRQFYWIFRGETLRGCTTSDYLK
jgi:hypothetical protein